MRRTSTLALALGLAIACAPQGLSAQKKGHKGGGHEEHAEHAQQGKKHGREHGDRAAVIVAPRGQAVVVDKHHKHVQRVVVTNPTRQVVAVSRTRKGPKFCRNGVGHPVFGRQWCVDHGFALGTARSVAVRAPSQRIVYLTEPQVVALVGPGEWAPIERRAIALGYPGPYVARSVYVNAGRVLTIRAGKIGIAQLFFDPSGHLTRTSFLR